MEDDVPKKKLKLKLSAKPDKAPSSSSDKKKLKKAKDKKRKAIESSSGGAAKKVKTENGGSNSSKKKKLKELDKSERLTFGMQAFLWWDSPPLPAGCQWQTMEHAGVSFPEEYVPHGVKMKYDGQEVALTPQQEEA